VRNFGRKRKRGKGNEDGKFTRGAWLLGFYAGQSLPAHFGDRFMSTRIFMLQREKPRAIAK